MKRLRFFSQPLLSPKTYPNSSKLAKIDLPYFFEKISKNYFFLKSFTNKKIGGKNNVRIYF